MAHQMRGTIGKRTFSNPNYHHNLTSISNRTSYVLPSSSSPFSTSSNSGGGRGRGGGGGSSRGGSSFIDFISPLGKSDSEESSRETTSDSPSVGVGHGRGRGAPLYSDPVLPSFSSFVSQTGSGRGRVSNEHVRSTLPPPSPMQPKQPVFVKEEDETESSTEPPTVSIQSTKPILPSSTPSSFSALSDLSGAGRGKPMKQPEPASQTKEENRHIRAAQKQQHPPTASLSQEEAVKKAMGILAKRSENEASGIGGGEGSMGMGGGRGRGRRRRQREFTRKEELDEDIGSGLFLGNNADGEKLARAIGSENMNKLVEGFEEVCSRVLPSPIEDAYVDALHTNLMVSGSPFKLYC